jgi:hypothetical protein
MSWNIKTPGDYINGPLTVAGSATITGDLTVATDRLKVVTGSTAVQIGATTQTQVGTTAWPSTVLGKSNARFLVGNEGIVINWNESAPVIGNYSSIFAGAKTGIGATTIGGLQIRAGIENASNQDGFCSFWTSNQAAGGYVKRYEIDSTGISTWSVAGTTAMTLNSSVLAIGVTPNTWTTYKALQVNSASIWSTTANDTAYASNVYYDGAYKFRSASSDKACMYIQFGGSHQWHYTASPGTAPNTATFTQAMTLDASGNLLVGTTSGSFGSRLVISADAGTTKWATGPLGAGPTNYYITANNTQGVFLNGTTATAWSAISDERFKDIIEPISNAIAKVGLLRSVIGKFKTDDEGTRRAFLIAQDVLAAFPEAAVATNPDKLAVTYTEVIPLLVAAIKELTARVQTLEAR